MTKYRLLRIILQLVLFAIALGQGYAQTVALTFYTNTAPYAALGAPMGYFLAITNTGSTVMKVNGTINLTAPDNSVYQILLSQPSINPGANAQSSGTFVSTKYTTQAGAFTLSATVTNKVGTVLASSIVPVTIQAVPPGGIYASVGGQGPDTEVVGYTYDFQTVTANLGTTSVTIRSQPSLVMTDGSSVGLDYGILHSLAPGKNLVTGYAVNTSQYSNLGGLYAVRVDIFDSSNNILATDIHNFTRNSIPSTTYVPTFTDEASVSGMNVSRTTPVPPNGCGNYTDFIVGGSGGAVGDYDSDGLDDIFAVDSFTGVGHLWHNNGNGAFTDMAAAAGIPVLPYESGANFADIDNDGYPDLLILLFNGQNVLLHNNGNGTFTNISGSAGIISSVPQNNISATWGDYDGDGYLDLYITVHADCAGANKNDHLYHNNGNLTFTDVTSLLGGSTAAQVTGRGLVTVFVDYNQDGRPDLYVGNDVGTQSFSYPNVLWRNDGPDGHGGWIFTDVSNSTGAGVAISSMGIGISDYNRDGRFDLFVTNYAANILLQQQSNGTFSHAQGDSFGGAHIGRATFPSPQPGIENGSCTNSFTCISVTWGTAFYDFNNDGWEDFYMTGGNTNRPGSLDYPNGFFLNHQDGTFLDITNIAGTTNPSVNRTPTALFGDFNGDGFEDIFHWGISGAPRFFVNNARSNGNPYNWLEVKLVGTVSNRDAVGARLSANVNGVNLLRTVYNGGTFQGNSSLVQHFGLGTATSVSTLTITWPSGMVQTLTNVAANQKIVVNEP